MKTIHASAIIILCSLTLLLVGCTERGSSSAPGAGIDSSLTSSENSVSDVLSESNISSTDISVSSSSTDISVNSSSRESASEQSSDVSASAIPVEFTDEDREVQKILSDLLEPADEIYSWMRAGRGTDYIVIFSDRDPEDYFYYGIFNGRTERFELPKTCSEMEKLMLDYFSSDMTEYFMKRFAVYNAVKNSDGTYTLERADGKPVLLPAKFVEVNGQLYCDDGISVVGITINPVTVIVTSKTDDTIEFTYLDNDWTREVDDSTCLNDTALYSKYALNGTLKYERGGWKLDNWDGSYEQ